ncbi:MAG: hypothetical protein Q7R30_19400 [Acidobacteriota bacterium]|nr:hypothetical protein [Acidobacteriota bacterium]
MLLFKMLRRGGGRTMDPLQVSMTGVRMGERFIQIGCDDRSLLAGLAAKVGLSGSAAVAVFDEASAGRARATGAKVGALIDVHVIASGTLPFDTGQVDMMVIDDTRAALSSRPEDVRRMILSEAFRTVRSGGRIEAVESMGKTPTTVTSDLEQAGFKPVRILAEKDGFRFVEGLKPNLRGEPS